MNRVAVALVVVVAATGMAGAFAAPTGGDRSTVTTASADGGEREAATTGTLDRPDPHTVIRVNVTQDGDAEVAIESRFLVNESDRNQTEAFESTYQDARDGTLDLQYSEETMRALVDDVAASTDREMAVENARWTRSLSNDTGTIALRFRWTNFGISRQETVVVGDAFQTDGGAWLPRLEDGQRLVLRAPQGYSALSPSDRVGEQRLVWDGAHDFEPGSPSATFGQQDTTPVTTTPTPTVTPTVTPTTTPTPGTTVSTTNGTDTGGGNGGSLVFWALLLVAVLSVGGGGYWYFNEYQGRDEGTGTPTAATDGATTVAESDAADAGGTDAEAGAAAGATAGATAASEAADEEAEDEAVAEDDGVDPELLSDEERVEHLLESNGGRMKQAQIVKETGWSNAKVSQLLSAMDEDDRIDKLRIGRENLITLPDEDVTDF